MHPSQVSEAARSWSQRENGKERERKEKKGGERREEKKEKESQESGGAERREMIMHVYTAIVYVPPAATLRYLSLSDDRTERGR